MIAVLKNLTYAKLFSAQIIALLGTGLLTVALGLLAFDIAGGEAGIVMGVAMSVKMLAYVVVAPVAAALLARLPRKPILIGAIWYGPVWQCRCRSSLRRGRFTS